MKIATCLKTGFLLAVALSTCSKAFAYRMHGGERWHHRGPSVGINIGAPLFFSPFHGYPGFGFYSHFYHYPAPITTTIPAPLAPIVYIEKHEEPADGFWHYCREPAGYYPEVPQCAGTWQKIPPSSSLK